MYGVGDYRILEYFKKVHEKGVLFWRHGRFFFSNMLKTVIFWGIFNF